MVTLHGHAILMHIDAAGSWWTTDGNTADHSKSPRHTDRKVSTDHRLSSRLIFSFFHYRGLLKPKENFDFKTKSQWKKEQIKIPQQFSLRKLCCKVSFLRAISPLKDVTELPKDAAAPLPLKFPRGIRTERGALNNALTLLEPAISEGLLPGFEYSPDSLVGRNNLCSEEINVKICTCEIFNDVKQFSKPLMRWVNVLE
ncbi:hypothetical protein CEXT_521001 [Caerostris extrusa]|uniref:Uncharacterized protein n=1 Tax=Caerostris extrusa TaxID=172846 RepID=A0AAV4X2T4_CAEEX|nr:hypothetical protein CEXT_521001 [Caerostris extrusa]